jgi:hypothetical protein
MAEAQSSFSITPINSPVAARLATMVNSSVTAFGHNSRANDSNSGAVIPTANAGGSRRLNTLPRRPAMASTSDAMGKPYSIPTPSPMLMLSAF